MAFHKIINDPVYGFITIDDDLVNQLIAHPYYQRLRRIYQMAMAHLVYPGAVHTRLHHSLGAYHLMRCALQELTSKGIEITAAEQQEPRSPYCCMISATDLFPMRWNTYWQKVFITKNFR